MKKLFIFYTTLFFLTATAYSQPLQDTVEDIDGNVYHTVKIGTQIWMVENFNVTHYRNGDPIPVMTNDSLWSELTKGAYCNYKNYPPNCKIYGKLYNFYAITDKRNIAPIGWHVPSEVEWQTLEKTLGMTQESVDSFGAYGTIQGGILKETDTIHWKGTNVGATNSSGFTALPGGFRDYNGKFIGLKTSGSWWTSTEQNSVGDSKVDPRFQKFAFYHMLFNVNSKIFRILVQQEQGCSVRCIKDN